MGRHLAENSLWIALVTILAAFDVKRAKDEYGHEIVPEIKFSSSIIRFELYGLAPFRVLILSHSSQSSLSIQVQDRTTHTSESVDRDVIGVRVAFPFRSILIGFIT